MRHVVVSLSLPTILAGLGLAGVACQRGWAEPAATPPAASAAQTPPRLVDHWPRWRGATGQGTVAGYQPPSEWPPKPPEPLWSAELGAGWSSPVCDLRRIYVTDRVAGPTDAAAGEERVLAFDRTDGRLVWQRRRPVDFDPHPVGRRHGNGPKATCVVADGKVYAVGIAGWLVCLDADTGRVIWSKHYPTEYGRRQPLPGGRAFVNREENVIVPVGDGQGAPAPLFGYTGSLLVDGNLLIAPVGGQRAGTIMAFDRHSGREVWRVLDENVSYSSPVVAELAGRRQVVVLTGPRAVGLDVRDGRLLWSHPFQIQYDESIATPVVAGNRVLITGDGYPLTALEIAPQGDGCVKSVAWQNRDLSCYLSSPVAHQGHVYGMNDGGEFVCVRLSDGQTEWIGGSHGFYTTPLLAEGWLLALNERGRLAIVSAAPGGYQLAATWPLADEATWTSPALADGRLYIRGDGTLRCYQLPPADK